MKLIDLVERQLKYYNEQNLDEFCKCFAENVSVTDMSGRRPPTNGMAAFRKMYEELFAKFPENHARIINRIDQGNFVFDQEEITGRGGSPVIVTAGYQMGSHLIEKVWFYW